MAVPVRRRETGTQPGTAARWDPFRELEQLHSQMGQLMQGVLPEAGMLPAWTPAADIEETDDAWIIELELAGVARDDIHIEARDNEIAITGEIKEKERAGILRRRTRRVGEFEYRVQLPAGVDSNHIEATLQDGVLTVRVPKLESARPRRIEVQS
jgi:HSP20 family protein